MFTVEIVSLGHFLWVSFPVFMESGEEQHFLRGKPAFRTQTLFQALQTGNVLSPIYVFHPVPRKHECWKTAVHVHGCVSDNTHTQNHGRKADSSGSNEPKLIRTQWKPSAPSIYQLSWTFFTKKLRQEVDIKRVKLYPKPTPLTSSHSSFKCSLNTDDKGM